LVADARIDLEEALEKGPFELRNDALVPHEARVELAQLLGVHLLRPFGEEPAVAIAEDVLHAAHALLERRPPPPLGLMLQVIEEVHDEDEQLARPLRSEDLERRVRRTLEMRLEHE